MLRMVSVGSAAIFECTDAIGAERGKLAKMQAADLRWRQLPEGGGADFPLRVCGSAAGSPRARRRLPGQARSRPQEEDGGSHDGAQRKPVSQPIQHAEKSAQT